MKISQTTSEGDEINVSLSLFPESSISEIKDILGNTDLIDIVLERNGNKSSVSQKELLELTEKIANYIIENKNQIFYYYCDEINPIPGQRKNRKDTPAEYRNKLFSILFEKIKQKHPDSSIEDRLVIIETSEGKAYIHLIYHNSLFIKVNHIENYLYTISQK